MLPPWTLAKQRVRWLSEGLIIGGRGFVSRQAATWNEKLGYKRDGKTEPDDLGWCRMRGAK
jgi:hypothetical protein